MTIRTLLLVFLVAALAVAAGVWVGHRDQGGVTARHVRGVTVAVGNDGTAVGLARDGEREGRGYDIGGVPWQDCSTVCGPWNDGPAPSCVPNLSSGQRIELGVVTIRPEDDSPGGVRVVWLRCLSAPTRSYAG